MGHKSLQEEKQLRLKEQARADALSAENKKLKEELDRLKTSIEAFKVDDAEKTGFILFGMVLDAELDGPRPRTDGAALAKMPLLDLLKHYIKLKNLKGHWLDSYLDSLNKK